MPTPLPINSTLKNLPVYQPGRPIEEVARELGLPTDGIIKLASNENPFGPSPLAQAAMQKAIAGVNLYPDGNAFYLKQKLAEKLGVEPANLILGNGSNEIIEFAGHALLGGRGTATATADVVVSQYCFAVYPIVTALFGANLITVPAKNYGHDLPAMLRAITPRTRIVFVANPNNPTGTLAPREEVIRFVNDVPDDVLLVMDEAYIDFCDDPLDLVPLVRTGKKTEPDFDADVLENLRFGRFANRLRHRASGLCGRTRKNPAAVQYQSARANRRIGRAGRRGARPQNATKQFRRAEIFRAGVSRLESRICSVRREFHSGPRRQRPESF